MQHPSRIYRFKREPVPFDAAQAFLGASEVVLSELRPVGGELLSEREGDQLDLAQTNDAAPASHQGPAGKVRAHGPPRGASAFSGASFNAQRRLVVPCTLKGP
jgi:hypothetical protein